MGNNRSNRTPAWFIIMVSIMVSVICLGGFYWCQTQVSTEGQLYNIVSWVFLIAIFTILIFAISKLTEERRFKKSQNSSAARQEAYRKRLRETSDKWRR